MEMEGQKGYWRAAVWICLMFEDVLKVFELMLRENSRCKQNGNKYSPAKSW